MYMYIELQRFKTALQIAGSWNVDLKMHNNTNNNSPKTQNIRTIFYLWHRLYSSNTLTPAVMYFNCEHV